ncbi:unnamed protein product [Schistosoma turkestanicum]|nr:unnamed protein product [Schistosoma turkestanicum]
MPIETISFSVSSSTPETNALITDLISEQNEYFTASSKRSPRIPLSPTLLPTTSSPAQIITTVTDLISDNTSSSDVELTINPSFYSSSSDVKMFTPNSSPNEEVNSLCVPSYNSDNSVDHDYDSDDCDSDDVDDDDDDDDVDYDDKTNEEDVLGYFDKHCHRFNHYDSSNMHNKIMMLRLFKCCRILYTYYHDLSNSSHGLYRLCHDYFKC